MRVVDRHCQHDVTDKCMTSRAVHHRVGEKHRHRQLMHVANRRQNYVTLIDVHHNVEEFGEAFGHRQFTYVVNMILQMCDATTCPLQR